MSDLAAQTMAGCRLTWPDACRRLAPRLAPRNRQTRAAPGALRLIAAGQVIGTVRVAHYRHGGHGGGAPDATVRSRIGGMDYEIDLSDRGRIPCQPCSAVSSRHGRTAPPPGASLTRTNPRGQSTMRGRERPTPAHACYAEMSTLSLRISMHVPEYRSSSFNLAVNRRAALSIFLVVNQIDASMSLQTFLCTVLRCMNSI